MVLLKLTIILLLSLNLAKFELEQYKADRYLDVIIDICTFHQSSVVLFSHADDPKDALISYTLLHSWSRAISRRGIMTLSIPFRKIWQTRINRSRLFNPLFVILLTDKNSFTEFSFATRHRDMSSVIWFVIFLWIPESSEIDYCHNPPGNVFSLTFNTEMMVLCPNDETLREWYSLYENRTGINDLATWKEDWEFFRFSNLQMHKKQIDMEGRVLRGVLVKGNPSATIKNGTLHGLFGILMNELSATMNFTLKIVKEASGYGTWIEEENRWTGALDEIASGRADIGIADFSMTDLRWSAADYTNPVIIAKDCLLIKDPYVIDIHWLAYFQTFTFQFWMVVILLLIISPPILCFLNVAHGRKNSVPLILEQCTNVFGIFCQQGLAEYPPHLPLRVAHSSLFLSAFVISAVYSAALICFLTFHTRALPFRSLEGFVEDGTYKLILIPGSANYDILTNSNESLARKATYLLEPFHRLPRNMSEAYMQVCDGNKIAFYTSDLGKILAGLPVPCKFICINVGRTDYIAFMLSKGNPFTRLINKQLQKFMTSGLMDHLKRVRLSKTYSEKPIEPKPIALYNVAPVLAILGGGFTLCVLMLLAEKLHSKLHRQN